jgi:hypothetical protein
MEQKPVPVTVRVDLWNFFPDMSATTMADCEIVYERHFLSKRQLADLKNMPGVDLDALREILEGDPTTPTNNYRERLRSINGAATCYILVTFKLNRDIDAATQDVRDRVSAVLRDLPRDADPPTISKSDMDQSPILSLTLSGNRSPRELTELADKIVIEFESV